jgi:hypothetical protein
MKPAVAAIGLPDYIQRGGEIVFSPPGVATGVRMYAFMLRAEPDRLQTMFDRYLNEPGGGVVHVVPAGSTIVLNVVALDHVGALTPPDDVRGYFCELEMAIWTLGYDEVSDSYTTFVPYMIVDRGAAMAMGREVYGFPKQLGTVTFPDAGDPDFTIDLDGLTAWGPDCEFTSQRLLTIPWSTPLVGSLSVDFESQAALVEGLARVLTTDRGLDAGDGTDLFGRFTGVVELLSKETLPMMFLKQVRDARQPTKACYRGIHTADFVVTGFRGAGRLPRPTLELEDLANVPIRRELGLDDGDLTPIDAFWVDFDFTLSVAEKMWVTPPANGARAVVGGARGGGAGR